MSKYQAPEGCTGISVGGEQFNVDEKGQIDVPAGDYHSLLAPHGFKPVIEPAAAAEPVKAPAKKAAAKVAANDSQAETAAAAEPAADQAEAAPADAAKTE